jgi:hypothetical protein
LNTPPLADHRGRKAAEVICERQFPGLLGNGLKSKITGTAGARDCLPLNTPPSQITGDAKRPEVICERLRAQNLGRRRRKGFAFEYPPLADHRGREAAEVICERLRAQNLGRRRRKGFAFESSPSQTTGREAGLVL